jgi:CubicO group peptidase (beta-lactamase class C family)
MNLLRIFPILLATLTSVGCGGSMNQSIVGRDERVSRYLDDQIATSKYPGMQYVVVDANRRLFEYDGGFSDVERRIPMKPTTTMMAYSMTKTFTAVAVLQLVERGKISLDESVLHYLPYIPYGPLVTVRQLLSQTSGIPNPIPLRWVHSASQGVTLDEEDALQGVMAANPRLAFAPGAKYAYSNISYWLLGKVIEQASGQPYETYMQRNVLAPLGLSAAQAGFKIADPLSQAKGYLARRSFMNLLKRFLVDGELIGKDEGRWAHILDNYVNGPAFGGLIATARGVSVLLQDQLGDRSVLLSPQTLRLFYSQQRVKGQGLVAMTLGWHIRELDGNRYFYKEGGGGGYHSEMRIYPEKKMGSVIMVNESSSSCVQTQDASDREFLR